MLRALGLRRKPPPQRAIMPIHNEPPNPIKAAAYKYYQILKAIYGHPKRGISGGGRLELVVRGARHLSLGIRLNDPTQVWKAIELAPAISLASKAKAVLSYSKDEEGLVIYQYELPEQYWEWYNRGHVTGIGIGLGEERRQIDFRITTSSPHTLVAGTTGSGKTVAIITSLVALVMSNTPDDLGILIIDPKFVDYHDLDYLAHLVMPIANDPEEINKALIWLNQELAHRKANKILDGRQIVCVIEEASSCLKDKQNLEIAQMVAKQGRAFRLNLIVGDQKPLHSTLPDILDNLTNRFVGKVSDGKVSAVVSGQPQLGASRLTGQGDMFHIEGGVIERFQVAKATNKDFQSLPRAEVTPPEIEANTALIEIPNLKPGAPTKILQPDILATYLKHDADISYRQAERAGITRTVHQLHKPFARDLLTELDALGLHLCGGDV